ncbi:uncharacterized protein LOC142761627 [Rhipicephalus microplus]|uniref:uncharacterized protein LOC142761627 n=1 Tax=Rhipicephalus microplus TaxID=6941 RepID=UPI003F6B14A0
MKNHVVAIFLILCFTSSIVNANQDVDAIIKAVKKFVQGLHLDEEESQKILSKINTAQEECLTEADEINPAIIKKLVREAIPAVIKCVGSVAKEKDPQVKKTKIIECVSKKADTFKETSGMTDEEKQKFGDALNCVKKLIEE